uniref:Protein asunder n=1 Tax=Heterorhabditis bacteriophora TaxID=37862 RepID=A0A1I7WMS4_HETBA
MESDMTDMIRSRNKIIQSLQDCTFAPIDHVKLFIINTYPQGTECEVTSRVLKEVSSVLSSSVVSRPAGDQLISATHSVTIMLYDLVSTTVSGIPMKEEAQQGQSVNYDVELLHPRDAHKQLEQLGLVKFDDITGTLMKVAENSAYATTRLSWATPSPKSKWNLFPRTRIALRATPAAVNSRPSVCLTSFLLQGRNVMLEVAFMLIIFTCFKDVLDSEELQKAAILRPLSSARITDFCTLIREAMLRPPKPGKETSPLLEGIPCGQARRQLLRLTRYWPLRMDHSFIYNIPKVIYQLVSLRDSVDPLTHQKVKTNLLKDPLNRHLEVNTSLTNFCHILSVNFLVFHMFMQTTGIDRTTNVSVQDVVLSDIIKKKRNHSEAASSSSAGDARNSSRSSSPIPKKTRKAIYQWKPNEIINLYEYLCEKEEKRTKGDWRDFVGRVEAGNRPANLYPNLDLNMFLLNIMHFHYIPSIM